MRTYCLLALILLSALCGSAQQSHDSLIAAQKQYMEEWRAFAKYDTIKCTSCTILPPGTIITKGLAKKRIADFVTRRTNAKQPGFPDTIRLNIKGMITMIDTVMTTVKIMVGNRARMIPKYDGLRIYIAAEKPDSKRPFLIFAATKADAKDKKDHPDDPDCYMKIVGDGVKKIKKSDAARYVANAQNGFLDTFRREGNSTLGIDTFHETHSLWYVRRVLKHRGLKTGLWDVLTCRECHGEKYVFAHFAAYDRGSRNRHRNRQYQLSMLYTFSNGPTAFISLNFLDDPGSGVSDTGNPCPPPKPCSLTGDALSAL